jgi:hypothetical protein
VTCTSWSGTLAGVPRYVTRLRLRTREPLTREQLHLFDGDRWGTTLRGKVGDHDLRVIMQMTATDPVGAVIRASNHVLDRVPGELERVEAVLSPPGC